MEKVEKTQEAKESEKLLGETVLKANDLRDKLGLENFSYDIQKSKKGAQEKFESEVEDLQKKIDDLKEKGEDALRKQRLENYMSRIDNINQSKDLKDHEKNFELSKIFNQAIDAKDEGLDPYIADVALNCKRVLLSFKKEALSPQDYERKLTEAFAKS